MENALLVILERVLATMDTSISFLTAELPDVVHQLLLWYLIKSIIGNILTITYINLFGYGLWGIFKIDPKTLTRDESDLIFIIGFFIWIISSTALAIFHINLQWLKILIAPKLWLIEYAATLVKGG